MVFNDIIATHQPPAWQSLTATANQLHELHRNDRRVRASCAAFQFWRVRYSCGTIG